MHYVRAGPDVSKTTEEIYRMFRRTTEGDFRIALRFNFCPVQNLEGEWELAVTCGLAEG